MKIITSRKIRIGMYLKLYKNGQTMHISTFTKKSSIRDCLQVKLWHKAYLRVIYDNNFYNDGIYFNLTSIKQALSAFTEKALLDYVAKVKGGS